MKFDAIDHSLNKWSAERKIPLMVTYKDEEVRSFELVGSESGRLFQVWLDVMDDQDGIRIHAWDRVKWRVMIESNFFEIEENLDRIVEMIRVSEKGAKGL
jgi:hypothetical protein